MPSLSNNRYTLSKELWKLFSKSNFSVQIFSCNAKPNSMQTKKLQIKKRVICKYQTPVPATAPKGKHEIKAAPDTTVSFPTSSIVAGVLSA